VVGGFEIRSFSNNVIKIDFIKLAARRPLGMDGGAPVFIEKKNLL
jgi:hypothetical protein